MTRGNSRSCIMALPEILKAKATKTLSQFCHDRIPPHVRDQIKLDFKFRGNTVTLIEIRPVWNDSTRHTQSPVAQIRFNIISKKWELYCCDRNSKWHFYSEFKPTANLDLLIKEIDRDPTGIFWG